MALVKGMKTILIIVAVSALAVFSYLPLTESSYFPMHDDMQVMRLYEMKRCFEDGQFPCRWVPDQGYGYGYPQFNFYSPLPYYLMYGIHLLGFSLISSVKAGFLLSFLLSALAMFALGRWLWGSIGGFTSALLYLYAPYRAMDVYNRGAMAEAWAFVFLPLIFLGIGRWVKDGRWRDIVLTAVSLAGLFMSHNITTVITLPFAAAWGLFWLMKEKKYSRLRGLLLAGGLGLGLAAFFVLPAMAEKQFVHVETILMGYFNYLAHFVSLSQLLFGTRWGYGSSVLGPNEQVNFSAGVFHWLFALAGLAAVWLFSRSRRRDWVSWLGLLLGGAFLVSVFLAHQASTPVWKLFSFLKWLQFPWRFLVLAVFFESLLAGLIFTRLSPRRLRLLVAGLIIGLIMTVNVGYFRPARTYPLTDELKLSGELWEEQQKISIFDYLPIWADQPPGSPAPSQPWAILGVVEVLDFQKGTDWQTGEVAVFSDQARVRLPLYHFPGMRLSVDGRSAEYVFDNELGLITFELPAGRHSFRVELKNTWPRVAGNLASLFSIGGLVWVSVSSSGQRRLKWFLG